MSPEHWNEIDKKVDKAEGINRRRIDASVDLYGRTGRVKERRGASTDIMRSFGIETRGEKKLAKTEAEYEKVVDEMFEDPDMREMIDFRKENLKRALRRYKELQNRMELLSDEEVRELGEMGETPNQDEIEIIREIREEKIKVKEEIEELKKENPESYYGLNLKQLKEYKRSLEKGELVETQYVKEHAEEIASNIRAGNPVFIHGHLGTGKTELAFFVAQKYLGKEALIISGSKHMSSAEMYGHQVLSLEGVDKEESEKKYKAFIQRLESEFDEWLRINPKTSKEERERHFEIIKTGLQEKLANDYASGTVSKFFKGQIYQAMEEGRPVIVDEVNAIPHELLISLNHLLTRRPGDKVEIQQDTGEEIEVKEGFGFILTGNLNKTGDLYKDRQDLDPAFLSRITCKIEHDYLPQKMEGSLSEACLGDGKGGRNELFDLATAMVMDKHGVIRVPEGEMEKVWNLVKMAKVTQEVFSGENINSAYFFDQGDGTRAKEYRLKEGVLSIRALNSIISGWKKDSYKFELDHYVYKFIDSVTDEHDKAYLYFLFKSQGGFFGSDGWDKNPDYGKKGIVAKFKVSDPNNKSSEKIQVLSQRETVDMVFGKGPERTSWPDVRGENLREEIEELEIPQEVIDFKESVSKILNRCWEMRNSACSLQN